VKTSLLEETRAILSTKKEQSIQSNRLPHLIIYMYIHVNTNLTKKTTCENVVIRRNKNNIVNKQKKNNNHSKLTVYLTWLKLVV